MWGAKALTERRKNPARKKATEVEYLVSLDQDGQRWTVTCKGMATGCFARFKSTAIGLAIRDASLQNLEKRRDSDGLVGRGQQADQGMAGR